MREGEDQVEVRHGQEIATTRGEPPLARMSLTLGTVSITAGMVGVVRRPTVITLGDMATEDDGAAGFDGAQGTVLDTAQAIPARNAAPCARTMSASSTLDPPSTNAVSVVPTSPAVMACWPSARAQDGSTASWC